MSETTIDFSQGVRVPEHVLFRELDGEAVILNLDDESYYGLDAVGTRMWIVLEAAQTIGEAHKQLLAEYDVGASQLLADMTDLIRELLERGLVIVKEA